jgi:enhancing lycopene biosynthesis protein 2
VKLGLLLSGCGVYDGAEIQEAVLAMLAIEEAGAECICISVDKDQHHVINHLDGSEMPESRNMLIESARIARGKITNLKDLEIRDIDALVIPGGFGNAKNFSSWAFDGPAGEILPEIKLLLVNCINVGKPIAALCVSPVLIAKALEGSGLHAELSLGTSSELSPYDIHGFHAGITATGAVPVEKNIREINIDQQLKIVTAPCYMMDASILEIRNNIRMAVEALLTLCV